jgi:HlyD family secretion protein
VKSLFLVLFTSVMLLACSSKTASISPSTESITESVYASGIVISDKQYQVYSTVNGILQTTLVSEGDTVSAGMPLFKLFNESSKLSNDNAALAAEFSDIKNNQAKITELKINLNLAAKKLEQDSLLFKRQTALWQQNIGSRLQYEQSELAYQNSKTAYEAARLRYNDLIRQLRYSSVQSQKNLEISSRMVRDFTINSEVSGRVYSILKKNGELVTPQTPIAIIGDAGHFIINLQVDEYDIVKVQNGMQVFVSLDSYKGEVFEARISKINPIMNERTKTFLVEALFVNQPPKLYPNLTVEANIVLQVKNKALTIPRQYLINDSFVLNSKGEKIPVKTGLKDYKKVEILSGISANDQLSLPK